MITLKPDISSRTNKNGKAAVMIRITQDRKVTTANINLWVEKKQWDKNRALVRRHPDKDAYNRHIRENIRKANLFILRYFKKHKVYPDRRLVVELLRGKPANVLI